MASGSYTFDNVTADHTISVVFTTPVVGPVYGVNNRSVKTDTKLVGKTVKVWGTVQPTPDATSFVISDGYSSGVAITGVTDAANVGRMVVVTGVVNADTSVTASDIQVF